MSRSISAALVLAGLVMGLAWLVPNRPASASGKDAPTSDEILVFDRKIEDVTGDILRAAAPPSRNTTETSEATSVVAFLVDPGALTRKSLLPSLRKGIVTTLKKIAEEGGKPPGVLVVRMTAPPTLVTAVSNDPKIIDAGLASLLAGDPENSFRDPCLAIRELLKLPAIQRETIEKLHVVLATMDNVDSESQIEQTVEMARKLDAVIHVIAPSSIYQDPYWERSWVRAKRPKKAKFDLHGPETGFREFPPGIAWQVMDPNGGTSSGMGYWALMRIATATGGRYYVSDPESTSGLKFCQMISCPLCAGKHDLCNRSFSASTMKYGNAVELGSRRDIGRSIQGDKLRRAILTTWAVLHEAKCVETAPPGARNTTTGNDRNPIPSPMAPGNPFMFPATFGDTSRARSLIIPLRSGPWNVWRGRAEQVILPLEAAAKNLRKAIKATRQEAKSRHVGAAETLLLTTWVTIFNLKQVAFFSEAVPDILQTVRGNTYVNVYLRGVPFCHGVDPALETEFLGEPAIKRDKKRIHDLVEDLLKRYRNTPWESVVRRHCLTYFEPYVYTPTPVIYRGPPRTPPRPRGSTEGKPETSPTTSKPQRPTRPDTRPGPSSGRATTGGKD